MLLNRSGKNKRTNNVSRNFLFQNWLTKAMEDAFNRELKSYYVYKKALSSLKKYPLVLQSGKECRILEGFGPKLCDMLDEKLANYAEELGLTPSEALVLGNNIFSSTRSNLLNTAHQHSVSSLTRSLSADQIVTTSPTTSENVACAVPPAMSTKFAFKRFQSIQFICEPKRCTDGHDEVMSVLRTSQNPNGCSLHELAACLRNEHSITDTSSVLTLLNELIETGRVTKLDSCPVRYRVNISGMDDYGSSLHALQSAEEGSNTRSSLRYGSDINPDTTSGITETRNPFSVEDASPGIENYPLKFVYADEDCQATRTRCLAHIKQFSSDSDGSEVCGYRMLCCYDELITSGLPYRLDWNGTSSDPVLSTVAYLLDPEAPDHCTGAWSQLDAAPSSPARPVHSDEPLPDKRPCLFPVSISSPVVPLQRALSEGSSVVSAPRLQGSGSIKSVNHQSASQNVFQKNDSLQTNYFGRVLDSSSKDTLVVPGDTYQLILLCDVREHFGLNKVRQLLPSVLQSLGVQCESRALPVGDFLWIVRWRNERNELKEAVLDYIVERKRADDLAHSITDGRFQEQKYRMKRTQIDNRFFLIEECPSMRNQRIPFETMLQATSNCQIIDGFHIMWTRSPEDTVDWLAALTNHLHSRSSSDVHVSLLATRPQAGRGMRARMWLDFVQLAQKSPPPTVRDMFAKQLLQIHGFSGSKVAALLQVYPTPHHLFQAYGALPTNHEREHMLSSLKLPGTNRTLGGALSRRVHLAYNTL
ncbi:Crossover junction endonuclease MUS81 [Fasciola gigantica]|uniref:Crossover junction endonuclease MUS81 n=1 Tax=Fasciola gigantica TaxID=46835 RepID=A0A504YCW7_FASGI|nr:Crossover junction endonuclease MUS81 [Fasciola gigantica]